MYGQWKEEADPERRLAIAPEVTGLVPQHSHFGVSLPTGSSFGQAPCPSLRELLDSVALYRKSAEMDFVHGTTIAFH